MATDGALDVALLIRYESRCRLSATFQTGVGMYRRRALVTVLVASTCVWFVSGCAEEETSSPGGQEATAEEAPEESEEAEESEEPEEPEEPEGVGDGTHRVPKDIAAGTYRSSGEGTCYWARLAGFSGELDDIIANGNSTPEIVTVAKKDAGFETTGCGDWVPVKETAPAKPARKFGDGTYQVGVHIKPGTYRADGGGGNCYWARLSDFSHAGVDGIIANGNEPTVIEIAKSDAGFTTSGCGTWKL
jgi:hypothetical protein